MGIYPQNPLQQGQSPYYYNQPVIQYQPVQAPLPHREIDQVNGIESAYAFPLGPNSSVVLVDTIQPKIYIVTTDASGFKVVTPMRVSPDNENNKESAPAEQPKEDPIEKLNKRLDQLEERMERYGKPYHKPTGQNKPGNAGTQSNGGNRENGTECAGSAAANIGQ